MLTIFYDRLQDCADAAGRGGGKGVMENGKWKIEKVRKRRRDADDGVKGEGMNSIRTSIQIKCVRP